MRSRPLHRWRFPVSLGSLLVAWGAVGSGRAAVIRVPEAAPGIQAAIDAAQTGDTVLISPGTYPGGLEIAGKRITLASRYIETGDTSHVGLTTLTGSNMIPTILTIQATAAAGTTVRGLSFFGGTHQIQNYARGVNILDNRFTRGSDQVSFENASGLVRDNIFLHASDDGLDIDNASEPTIENNIILDAGNDGIELRLHNYTGPTLKIVIRGNYIAESDEDGIQLIDYPGASSRDFLIEGNTLVNNLMVGLGCMADGNTDEDFAGSPMVESVRVIGNTIIGSPIGVTGGDNMLLLNNIIAGNFQFGVKRVAGSSLVSHNAFWGNATHHSGSNVESSTTMIQDPDLDGDYHLEAGSPCIDAGAISIVWNGKKVSSKAYLGMAPDLGAHEGPAGPIGPLSVPAPSAASGMRVTAVHPNPSSKSVAISFTLIERSPARIELVDLAGRKILVRDLGAPGRGNHVVRLHETRSLPAGVYQVRLVQGERSVAAPMVVAR